eukprot:190222-Hanusia_phi.AAC.10
MVHRAPSAEASAGRQPGDGSGLGWCLSHVPRASRAPAPSPGHQPGSRVLSLKSGAGNGDNI